MMGIEPMSHEMTHLLFVVGLSLLAGQPACSSSPRRDETTIVVVRARDSSTLDPARATDIDSMDVIAQVYETLVAYAPGGFEVQPGLAVRWTRSTDLKVWTFTLRKDVRFHDGTKMNADAVVYSFLRQARGGLHQKDFVYWNSSFSDIIQDVKRVSEYKVRFLLTRPFAPFLESLAMFPVSIVSPSAARIHHDDLDSVSAGTGPFKVTARDRKAGTVTLKAFSGYWGKHPKVGRIVFRAIRDARHRLLALESGAAQIMRDIDPDTQRLIQLHPELQVVTVRGNTVAYVALNTSRPPFNNPYARWAVNRAVRKKALVKLVYQGLAEPARGPLPPAIKWAYNAKVATYPYDPKRARQDLAAAGYHDDPMHRPALFVMDTPRPYLPRPLLTARMIAKDLERIGMPLRIVAQSFSRHKASMKRGEPELALYGWVGDNGDPDNFLYTLLSPRSPLNMSFWHDAEYSALVDAAREARLRNERADYYKKAQVLVAKQAPWIPLAYTKLVVAVSRRLSGFNLQPTSILRLATVRMSTDQ